jgi:hypothetical protein
MSLNEVLVFIATASKQDAKAINEAAIERIKWHIRLDNINIRASMVRGTEVNWKSEKHGYPRMMHGKVMQVNTSTAKIKADDGQIWRISLSLLEVGA